MNFERLYDIEILSLYEYSLRMKAFNLAQVDSDYNMHLQAWLYHQAAATKNVGTKDKPKQVLVYKKFEDFFNYKKRIEEIEGKKQSKITPQMRRMAQIAAKVNEGR